MVKQKVHNYCHFHILKDDAYYFYPYIIHLQFCAELNIVLSLHNNMLAARFTKSQKNTLARSYFPRLVYFVFYALLPLAWSAAAVFPFGHCGNLTKNWPYRVVFARLIENQVLVIIDRVSTTKRRPCLNSFTRSTWAKHPLHPRSVPNGRPREFQPVAGCRVTAPLAHRSLA